MFDQVKTKIVFPNINALTLHQSRDADHCRWLPDYKIGLPGKSSRFEVSLPVDPRRFDGKVGTLPRIVLLRDVGGVLVGSESLRNANLKGENARRRRFRIS